MSQQNPQQIRIAIITVAVAAVIGVLSVFAITSGDITGKLFLTAFSLIIFSITATICYVVSEKLRYKGLGVAGMATSGLGFLLTAGIIFGGTSEEGLMKFAFALLIASIALAHISLLHHFNLQNKYAVYARITATICISIFSLILITRVFEPFTNLLSLAANQSTAQLAVAALIVDLAATILVPLCNRLPVGPYAALQLENEIPPVTEDQPDTQTQA